MHFRENWSPLAAYRPEFNVPILLIKNTSHLRVDVLGAISIEPGDTKEIFSSISPDRRNDILARAIQDITPPSGQLYLNAIAGRIEILDFRAWNTSVDYQQIRAVNTAFANAQLVFNGTDLVWTSAGTTSTYTVKSDDYIIQNTDRTIEADTSGITITLPTALGIAGQEFRVINTSSGEITVTAVLSQTIGNTPIGSPALMALYPEEWLDIISNGSNWRIV